MPVKTKVGASGKPRREMILQIKHPMICIEVNQDVYDSEDYKKIRTLVREMSKEIWIDKTYVNYKGTRWRDAFIVEDKWYELLDIAVETDYGKNCSAEERELITQSIAALVLTYMYQILTKYGYDIEHIDLSLNEDSYTVEYIKDNRKTWDM